MSAAAAESALAGVAAGLERLYPGEHQDKAIVLAPLPRFLPDAAPATDSRPIRLLGIMLLGLTGAVLLIVSLNLAGLLLVRGHARRKEFAIRLALGGTRARLVRQLLTEGLVLALVGGALGCLCSFWVGDLVIAAISSRLPVTVFPIAPAPWAIVGVTLVFCTIATLFFALGPALTLARRDLVPDLQQNAGEDVARRRRWLPRHPARRRADRVVACAHDRRGPVCPDGRRAVADGSGIDANHTLIIEYDASLTGHDRARTLEIFRTVGERLAVLPGVRSVSIAASAPYSVSGDERSVRRAGTRPAPDDRPATAAEGLAFNAPYNAVGADFFTTLGVPLLRGRAFTRFETDHVGAAPVAVIDEVLAAQLWPGEDALGRRIEWAVRDTRGSAGRSNAETIEIVGIARTTDFGLWETRTPGAIYVPFAQGFTGNVYFFSAPRAPARSRWTGCARRSAANYKPLRPT